MITYIHDLKFALWYDILRNRCIGYLTAMRINISIKTTHYSASDTVLNVLVRLCVGLAFFHVSALADSVKSPSSLLPSDRKWDSNEVRKKLIRPLANATVGCINNWNQTTRHNYRVLVECLGEFLGTFNRMFQKDIDVPNRFESKKPYIQLVYSCHIGELERLSRLIRSSVENKKNKNIRRAILRVVCGIIESYPIWRSDDYSEDFFVLFAVGTVYSIEAANIDRIVINRLSDSSDMSEREKIPLWIILSESRDPEINQKYREKVASLEKADRDIRKLAVLYGRVKRSCTP